VPSILSGEEISLLIRKINNVDSGEQRQPAGFDVTLNKLFSYPKDGSYVLGISKTVNSALEEITPNKDGEYELKHDAYVAELNEVTSIPEDSIGILLPRSTLLRNGLDIRSALFDPGYSGQPKVMLVCHRPKARIARFARIGQLIMIRSEGKFGSLYSGRYQGEGEKK